MSRLQVGGLALVINSTSGLNIGKVVELMRHYNVVEFDDGSIWQNCWVVTGNDILGCDGLPKPYVYSKAEWLMPLGDKKTQDELLKEKELENV